ncbi:hypothetical protein [Salipaludibacillus agaradhaerens]|nr:hypothetical protein [Salipaludibacillus agaradhaerens]
MTTKILLKAYLIIFISNQFNFKRLIKKPEKAAASSGYDKLLGGDL